MLDHGSIATLIIGLDHARRDLDESVPAVRRLPAARSRRAASRARLAGVLRAAANQLEPVPDTAPDAATAGA